MSLSISGIDLSQKNLSHSAVPNHDAAPAKAAQSPAKANQTSASPTQSPAKPTEEQILEQLVAEGQSTQQIANALGLTVTQVEEKIGTTSASQAAPASLVALAGRLSIKV